MVKLPQAGLPEEGSSSTMFLCGGGQSSGAASFLPPVRSYGGAALGSGNDRTSQKRVLGAHQNFHTFLKDDPWLPPQSLGPRDPVNAYWAGDP